MKTINILEHVYQCSDEAYLLLGNYLSQIHSNFKDEPELIRDIELGVIEQLDNILSDQKKRQLSKIDVDYMIQKMGNFEPLDDEVQEPSTIIASQQLYRDYDNRLIAGVCAGLAAYFNLSPWIMRMIFIVLLFTPIPIIIPYLLMWYLLPPAMTKSEKLNMKGIPVSINSIVNYNQYTRNKVIHLAKLLAIFIATIALIVCSIVIAVYVF